MVPAPSPRLYLADMGPSDQDRGAGRPGGPGGDSSRQSGPHFLGPDDSHFYQTFNLGKKSVTLDIRKPQGQAALHRLVAGADAVVNNLRGDQPEKLGLITAAAVSGQSEDRLRPPVRLRPQRRSAPPGGL